MKLHKSLKLKGYKEHLFSSHSFRWGDNILFSVWCPYRNDQIAGGWKSDVFYHYLEFPLEAHVATTELMKHRIQILNW